MVLLWVPNCVNLFALKFGYAEGSGVDGSVRVPRTGLRPILLLYLTAPSTPLPSAACCVGVPQAG